MRAAHTCGHQQPGQHLGQLKPPDELRHLTSCGSNASVGNICAALPDACKLPMEYENFQAVLDNVAWDVNDERRARPEALFNLFIGASNAADALLMAKLAEARCPLANLARKPA